MSRLWHRVLRYLTYYVHWRCVEPVVVFESDDWGLARRPCSEALQRYGTPGEWASEQLETAEDLHALYQVLSKYRDHSSRPACFSSGFIVANPDFDAIRETGFSTYCDVPISEYYCLVEVWKEGFERQLMSPEYHGRSHFCTDAWLRDLQEQVPGAIELFYGRYNGGLSLLRGQGWRYHSEYLDWHKGVIPTKQWLFEWIRQGIDFFRSTFGRSPLSTIAPHYIFPSITCQVWADLGIKYVQGTGYRIIRTPNGGKRAIPHFMGERFHHDLVFLVRTVKFEPRPQRMHFQGLTQAISQIERCFQNGIPAVIDTHRINYTGSFREQGLMLLDNLLSWLMKWNVRFLTSAELGEAIRNQGVYRDLWSGELRYLTPMDTIFRQTLRVWLHRLPMFMRC
jgi:hypothetical protein